MIKYRFCFKENKDVYIKPGDFFTISASEFLDILKPLFPNIDLTHPSNYPFSVNEIENFFGIKMNFAIQVKRIDIEGSEVVAHSEIIFGKNHNNSDKILNAKFKADDLIPIEIIPVSHKPIKAYTVDTFKNDQDYFLLKGIAHLTDTKFYYKRITIPEEEYQEFIEFITRYYPPEYSLMYKINEDDVEKDGIIRNPDGTVYVPSYKEKFDNGMDVIYKEMIPGYQKNKEGVKEKIPKKENIGEEEYKEIAEETNKEIITLREDFDLMANSQEIRNFSSEVAWHTINKFVDEFPEIGNIINDNFSRASKIIMSLGNAISEINLKEFFKDLED